MNSRSWGPDRTPGDGSRPDRGTAGADAPIRTGSARVVIAMAAFNLTLLCVAIMVITRTVNAVGILALFFLAVYIWAVGAHRLAYWVALFRGSDS